MLYLRKLRPISLLILSVLQVQALDITRRENRNPQIFGIEFPGNARAFYGTEAAVQSISKQEYVTSTFRVTEINIVTQGKALLRIYYSRPLRPGELQAAMGNGANASGVPAAGSIIQRPLPQKVQEMADRAAGIVEESTGTNVFKEYPIATHAHTIEYRVSKLSELTHLYDELIKHWLNEPTYYEGDRITEVEDGVLEPRKLGGSLFKVEQ